LFHFDTFPLRLAALLEQLRPPAQRHRSKSKLLLAFTVSRHQLCFVCDRMRSVIAKRLEQTQEYGRALTKPAVECDLLTAFTPFHFGAFYEKRFVVIPAGNLCGIQARGRVFGSQHFFLHRLWVQANSQGHAM
jgi:hypothetical protein